MEEYLTVKDVAKMMQVGTRTVLRWIERGKIRPSRIGRTLRFRRSRLIEQLDKLENGDDGDEDPAMG